MSSHPDRAERARWELSDATAELYAPTGHGIVVRACVIAAPDSYLRQALRCDAQVDVVGGVWACAPAGVETIAKMSVLPLAAADVVDAVRYASYNQTVVTMRLASKSRGQFGILHGTIRSTLDHAVSSGDPLFALEVLSREGDLLFQIPTRPSLIRDALFPQEDPTPDKPEAKRKKKRGERPPPSSEPVANDGEDRDENREPLPLAGRSILYRGPVPDFHRTSVVGVALRYARWLLFPALLALLSWALLLAPAEVLSLVPQVPMLGTASNVSYAALLPPVPRTLSEAWSLSQLESSLRIAEAAADPLAVQDVLARAAQVAGRQAITSEQLHHVPDRIAEVEAARGVIARVVGFFTFVNILWLLAILGITVSVAPALAVLAWPLFKLLMQVAEWFVRSVVVPVGKVMHRLGVFEALGYFVCFMFIADGARRPVEWGFFVSFTGIALSVPCWAYSLLLHGASLKRAVKSKDGLTFATAAWICSFVVPAALQHQSVMLAFAAVWAVYTALGFSVVCYGLCWCVGFHSKNAIERVCATSFVLLALFTGLRAAGLYERYTAIAVFSCPVQVMGSVTLLLGGLIYSSFWFRERSHGYVAAQLGMLSLLATMLWFGLLYAMPSMTNTAITFAVLWGAEKYCEFHVESGFNAWVLILAASVALWRAVLYLHTHPEFIVKVFSP
eukprot:m51a1_g3377 hypothetical protein (675) ;mRNA; r:474843-477153